MSTTDPTRPVLDERDQRIGDGVHALVDGAPAITIDEVRTRPVVTPLPARPAPRPSSAAWRLAAAAAVVLVLVGVLATWRSRSSERPLPLGPVATGRLLPVPADPTGPVAAENTGASSGEPDRSVSARWDVVRTGADDRQLVVYFSGAGPCAEGYQAEVTETPESVTIAVHQAGPPVEPCGQLATWVPGAIGIQLAAPLGDRRLVGWTPVDGSAVTGPLVVRGEDLATLTWPAGSVRAATEDLGRTLDPDDWVWTQTFTDPSVVIEPPEDSSNGPTNPTISLQQWHGATQLDEGAGTQACQFQAPRSTEVRQVDGVEMTLIRCPLDGSKADGGVVAVAWMEQTLPDVATRFLLRAEPGSMDVPGLLALAESVRRGG